MDKKLLKFESLSLDSSERLFGGFSAVFLTDLSREDDTVNNCKSGNCKEGCNNKGKKKKKMNQPIPNGNCGAGKNCVKGCGN